MPPKKFYKKYKKSKKLATKDYVKRQILKDVETKYIDSYGDVNPGTAGALVPFTDVSQGVTDVTRIGDKLTIRRLNLYYNLIGADTTNIFRVILFQWYVNTNIKVPAISDILQQPANKPWLSTYVNDYQDQFHVFYDKKHAMSVSGGNNSIYVKAKLKLKYLKKTVQYLVGGIEGSNKCYMIVLSDSTTVSHPQINYYCRFQYDDA